MRYSEPLVRLRILDPLLQQKYGFPVADFSLAISAFAKLQLGSPRCFITENMMPFLTLPALADGIAILGAGYAVNRLKLANWLLSCRIFYWGDLDSAGFDILSQVRTHFPQTQSILMDLKTYQTFRDFEVPDRKATVETSLNLRAEEQALYLKLAMNKRRLEQERISQDYVNRILKQID
nr:DUF2220 domain-containing protein [cf. Phormidesmis sp. LEGE 11477]